MRPLKLHTKTTVLASVITVAVLGAALAVLNPRVADVVNQEQRTRAELQAINLAEQISHLPPPHDPQMLARAATIVRGARPSIVTVRVWERVGGIYKETAAAAGSEPAEDFPDETKAALRNGLDSKIIKQRPDNVGASIYRVFAPITEEGRFSGAVELVERLDDAPLIAVRFERAAFLMALISVFLITLATYLMFRHVVYRPIERLLGAMSRAEAGDLEAQAPPRAPDELGLLSGSFNRMIARIREMSNEREAQRKILQERVHEATIELEQRNEQLEDVNRELWQTTRRLTELERLAAAGQTAAQFAHEVGTPLNLISGHVQLLRTELIADERAEPRLETITGQIERIERIVRAMLDRTRPERFELAPLDLNALLLRIFDATQPVLDAHQVQLETELAANLPFVAGDADRLQQVFINLVNNALDAMPDGGCLRVSAKVDKARTKEKASPSSKALDNNESNGEELSGRKFGDEEFNSKASRDEVEINAASDVVIEFADTGYGIEEIAHARIFDPFYTTKEKGRGTGLGLFVVRQVVCEHGGEIKVQSEAGKGARFFIRLPVARDAALVWPDQKASV